MESLDTFLQSYPSRLLHLAKKLQEKNAFDKSLTEFQLQLLTYVLQRNNVELWSNFLDGNCYLKISKTETSDATDKDDSDESYEEGSECINQLALHLRYLLWEKAIDFYYDKKNTENGFPAPVIEELSEDYELIESLDQILPNGPDGPVSPVDSVKKTIRDEEDDYDDDDDDEMDDKDVPNGEADGAKSDVEYNENGQVVLSIPKSVFSKGSTEETEQGLEKAQTSEVISSSSASLEEQEDIIKTFNKVYHNFEYDRETLIKRRKLEKSDMQLEDQKTLDDSAAGSIPIHLVVASHSLKHLLSTIQERRDDISLNDFELRNLFMDVRKNRGKWANDERVGQEELYDACEKVLLDLRGYTEHSTPFLNKVSKREAPNYGLIIKEPMDLNTVMKKLKGLSYNSKQEFVDDLMLIWNNCLTYNADPKHFMRAHAIAMQKRTQRLAPSIPNIVIRNRSEIEKEEELDADTKASTPALKGGKASKKGRMRKREEIIKSEEPEGVDSIQLSEAVSVVETPIITEEGTPLPMEAKPPIVSNGTGEENGEEDEDEGEDEMRGVEEDDEQDPEMQAWKTMTAKSRANYCATRAALFDQDYKLKMDAEAIIRDPSKMSNFNQFLSFKEVVSKGNKLLDNDEPYLLEYDVAGGVPGLAFPGVDEEAQQKFENDMVDAILRNSDVNPNEVKSKLVLPTDSGLNRLYTNNITEIQEIRKICFKISLIRQMQTQQFVHRTQMRQPEIQHIQEVDIDPVSKLPNHDIFNDEVQFAALRKSIAKIAMHTGFETTEPFAINTLAQLAEKYMLNLAKSMKLHCESTTRNKLNDREVLLLTLLENGVEKPDDLFTFVEEKAKKHEAKLKDLRQKLSGFLKDLLRPSLESFNEKSFEDNSEQFATGDFTSELGDDFFGFKELGLDKEFKMLSSSIPVYLLHSRLQSSLTNVGSTNKTTRYEDLRDWKQKQLTVTDVESQIGLLRPFYWELVQKTEVNYAKQQKRKGESTELPPPSKLYLLEDEELPQKQRNIRPRLPPTGKIAAVKKKLLSSAFILPEEFEEEDEVENGEMFDIKSEIKMEA